MATPLVRPAPSAPSPPMPSYARQAPTPELKQAGMLFAGYLLIILIEYGAITIFAPILKITRASTLISYAILAAVVVAYKGEVLKYRQSKLVFGFVVFAASSMLWAVVRSYVPLQVRYLFDYWGFLVISMYVIDNQKRIDQLSFLFAGIGAFLVFMNIGKMGGEIRAGAFWAPYFMGDGNDFGWGLNVMVPFVLNLAIGKGRSILTRLIGLGAFLVLFVGIIGTESRGATLAIGAGMILYWATISKRKALGVIMLVLIVVGVGILAPSAYLTRMNSIGDYEDDGSAQGRLRAWRSARQMALDYPLGAGAGNFNSAYGRFYRPDDAPSLRWMSAHSVYFKVLGEHGYPGLCLLLLVIFSSFRDNFVTAYKLRHLGTDPPIHVEWPLLLNVGLVTYSISAMFLGGLTYPHLFMLVGLSLGARRLADMAVEKKDVAPASTPAVSADRLRPVRAGVKGPGPVGGPLPDRTVVPVPGGRFF